MDAKHEEQARQMSELSEQANLLQHENERLRTRLETNRGDNSKGPIHPTPPAQPNKGKEPILMGESDPPTDDELSSSSSSLIALSPPKNNAKAKSKKRPPCRSSRSVSGARHRVPREASRDRLHSELVPEYKPI